MSGNTTAVPAALPPFGILARLKTVAGIGSGLDADLVRGQALPAAVLRFDPSPQFTPPPLYGDATLAAYSFGV